MYKFEVWFDGQCIRASAEADTYYDTKEDAEEEGNAEVISIMEDWEVEGCYEGETVNDFEVRVLEGR